jgi:hypothetical protein
VNRITPMMLTCHWRVVKSTPGILFIEDLDDGGMSVTNAAEHVCDLVHYLRGSLRIVYRDTMGRWDELVHQDGVFQRYAPYDGEVPA